VEIPDNAEFHVLSCLGALGDLSRDRLWTGRILPRDVANAVPNQTSDSLDWILGRKA
jgi:hypothetical protein